MSKRLVLFESNGYFPSGNWFCVMLYRGGSRTAATSKMEDFLIIVNGLKSLTIITKGFILDFSDSRY